MEGHLCDADCDTFEQDRFGVIEVDLSALPHDKKRMVQRAMLEAGHIGGYQYEGTVEFELCSGHALTALVNLGIIEASPLSAASEEDEDDG